MSESAKKAAPAKGEKKPMNFMPILMGVVLVMVLAIGAKVFLGGSKANGKATEKKKAEEVGISMPLEEFLVNLNGEGDHYLKTTISLGLRKGLTEEQVKEKVAPMRDAILTILSTKSVKGLNAIKERETLKDEIKEKINKAVGEEPVVKVYFTAFATQ